MNRIQKLSIKNFRSWEDISIDMFSDRGLCLINAHNGGGKSSIRMALEYLLLDTTLENISVSDLIRRGTDKFELECVVLTGDKEIEIKKSRSHKKANISILVNGEENLAFANKRETQKELLQLLGITKESLFFSSIFTKDSPSFVDVSDSQRKELLYDFLNLWRFDKYRELAKEYENNFSQQVNKITQDIEYTEMSVKSLDSKIISYREKADKFEENIKKKVKILKERLRELVEHEIESIERRIKKLQKKYNETRPIVDRKEKLEEKLTELKRYRDKVENKIELLEERLDEIQDNTCPILKRPCELLAQEKKGSIKEIKNEIVNLEKAKSKFIKDIKKVAKEYDKIIEQTKEITEMEYELFALQNERRQKIDENDVIARRRKQIKTDIRELKNSENDFEVIIQDLKKEKNKLLKNIKDLQKQKKETQDQIPLYGFWVKGFGRQGIPNLEIERILGLIEEKTNYYLSFLSGKMAARITAQSATKGGDIREKIGYDIIFNGVNRVPVATLSEGEKQRVKIANLLAFSDIVRKFDFLILDEVLDLSLDESGSKDVLELLRHKASDIGSIYVMSHKTKIKSAFDNVIDLEMM